MVKYVKDIAGVRIICSFTPDIYRLADMISRQNYLKVLEVKDYIKNPKPSGYTSYHMIVSVPVNIEDRVEDVKVEIQIRTVAMDFWASLEHKIQYKYEGQESAPEYSIGQKFKHTGLMGVPLRVAHGNQGDLPWFQWNRKEVRVRRQIIVS